ncbi:uncharacterized protein LOC123307360 isoform X2 [Coccinella septempunctata]|uniref:uncharacterized protein LOC123307360 isoform X2 n=1 Tax=Coccinella septempunctata TaxID=41139 RepID=UPI001D0962A2|nr:uncharacterized protein LOC123307360 isoform X2 [Coccinella septempunctata]
MSIKDRLKTAYENVALNGDTTWTDSTNTFQEANKKLFSREQQLKNIRIIEERPRTVKDSIPHSKLATYDDYEYNEARELCYTRCIQKTQIEFLSKETSRDAQEEPWLLPDVDTLFIWFICCQNQKRNDCGAFEYCNQHGMRHHKPMEEQDIHVVSPLLNAVGFQEKKLKMAVISDKVKIIWNTQKDDLRQRCIAFARDIDLTLSKLPSLQFYNGPYDPRGQGPFLDEDLATSFKQQNGWMSKSQVTIQELDPEPIEPKIEEPYVEDIKADEPVCPKRLYSAVLQGLTSTELAKKDSSSPPKAVPKLDTPSSLNMIFPKFSVCCASSVVSTVTDFGGSPSHQQNQEEQNQVIKTEMRIQKNTSIQTNVKILPKAKSVETTPPAKTTNVVRETLQQNSEDFRSPNAVSFPLIAQSSYMNNYSYQFNASHYSNTYQNSCGCTNTFSHTSQVITNRNMQTFPRQSPFIPSQFQYAQPVLMLQQNRTSIYPISQPVQTPYYYQPLQQTRVMQRWIVPQSYSRPNMTQGNFLNPHFVPQSSSLWMGPNQQQSVPSTSQYFMDNRLKTKPKKATQPQMNILKSKSRKNPVDSTASTETTDSEVIPRSLCANSTSSCIDAPPTMVQQLNKLALASQLKVKSDFEEVVSKTVNLLFEEDVPVTSTVSEELEIQALEQYCNSNDNVYQELERQAAEQYDELSENLRGPPTHDLLFGGLSSFFPCSIDVNV